MVHACCNMISLQLGTKIVSIIDAVFAMFGAITGLLAILGIMFYREELETEVYRNETMSTNTEFKRFLEQPEAVQYSLLGFTLLVCILEIIVAVILFKGARTRNASRCTVWFHIHCVLLVLGLSFSIIAVVTSEERVIISTSGIVGLLYQIYTLWLVKSFIDEINSHRFRGVDDEQGEPLQDIEKAK